MGGMSARGCGIDLWSIEKTASRYSAGDGREMSASFGISWVAMLRVDVDDEEDDDDDDDDDEEDSADSASGNSRSSSHPNGGVWFSISPKM
jgi:hypothetical protein